MKVRAKKLGYYGLRRRQEGEVFELKDEKFFSETWMEKLESKKKSKPAKKKEEPKVEEDLELF